MTIRSITVTVTPWPNEEAFDNDDPKYQWDLEIDGEWAAGGTGPGDALAHVYYAAEAFTDANTEK